MGGINLQDAKSEYCQEENIGQTSSAQNELQDKILYLNRKHEEDREEIRKLKMDNVENKLKNEEDREEIRKLRMDNDKSKLKHEEDREEIKKHNEEIKKHKEEIKRLKIENDETKSKNEQLKTDLGILDNKVNMLLMKFQSLDLLKN